MDTDRTIQKISNGVVRAFGISICIITNKGRIRLMSKEARDMLSLERNGKAVFPPELTQWLSPMMQPRSSATVASSQGEFCLNGVKVYVSAWPIEGRQNGNNEIVLVFMPTIEALEKQVICHFHLSQREGEVFSCLVKGKSPKQIAALLKLADPTVRVYLTRICQKLGLDKYTELPTWLLRRQWSVSSASLETGPLKV